MGSQVTTYSERANAFEIRTSSKKSYYFAAKSYQNFLEWESIIKEVIASVEIDKSLEELEQSSLR